MTDHRAGSNSLTGVSPPYLTFTRLVYAPSADSPSEAQIARQRDKQDELQLTIIRDSLGLAKTIHNRRCVYE